MEGKISLSLPPPGAMDLMEMQPGRYAELVREGASVDSLTFEEIERDLHR